MCNSDKSINKNMLLTVVDEITVMNLGVHALGAVPAPAGRHQLDAPVVIVCGGVADRLPLRQNCNRINTPIRCLKNALIYCEDKSEYTNHHPPTLLPYMNTTQMQQTAFNTATLTYR